MDFNIAGNAIFTTSCGAWGTTNCVQLQSQISSPLPITVHLTTTIKTTGAILTPQTFSFVYRRITAYSNNNTFLLDVRPTPIETGTWLITTFKTTYVSFFGVQPTSITCSCSFSYNGYAELLAFGPNLFKSSFTVGFTSNINPLCLCAMIESNSAVGDLSVVVAKELEFSYYMATTGTPTLCTINISQCSWGFFLTTNQSLWETSNSMFTPYNDPTIALFSQNYISTNGGGVQDFHNILYVQQKTGETITQEDTGCNGSGSVFICTDHNQNFIGNGESDFVNLNFTGGSSGAQVGNGANCLLHAPNTGGSSCSYIAFVDTINGVGQGQQNAASFIFPQLPLTSVTYYIGFWVGAKELNSPILFCFDSGTKCSAQQTFIVQGCVSASLELDSCVPNPTSNNGVSSVTDSGGFFGSVGRFFSGIGSTIQKNFASSIGLPSFNIGGFIGSLGDGLSHAFGVTQQILVYALIQVFIQEWNYIGSIIGIPNIGTNISQFIFGVVTLVTVTLGLVLTTFSSAITWLNSSISITQNFILLVNAINITTFVSNIASFLSLLGIPVGDLLFLVGNLSYFGGIVFIIWYFYVMFRTYFDGAEAGLNVIIGTVNNILSLSFFFLGIGVFIMGIMVNLIKGALAKWI